MPTNQNTISVSNLTKSFGRTIALNELNLEVGKGEVHGLLGPNGAGKSTTIRVLLGLLRKDSGDIELLGGDPWSDAVDIHSRLAYVPGEVNLWENLSGGEIIDLLTHLRGHHDPERKERLIERFKLDPTKRFRTYSKGNRQKVALVSALASDVDLYILDEPTSGLDPLLELVFQDEIRKLKDEGKTILLSSHILAEVEALCDQVTIIREGQVVESGSLDKLRHLTRTTVKVATEQAPDILSRAPGIHDLKLDGNYAEFEVEPQHLSETMKALGEIGIKSITSHPPTLEELFMSHYKDAEADQ